MKLYKMKEVCDEINMPYETLRYYCNEGLVPNVKRDDNNHRLFDNRDMAWLKGLQCLRVCGLNIAELKNYMNLCLEGPASIKKRKAILTKKKEIILKEIQALTDSVDYIDQKQAYYNRIPNGEEVCSSNSILVE